MGVGLGRLGILSHSTTAHLGPVMISWPNWSYKDADMGQIESIVDHPELIRRKMKRKKMKKKIPLYNIWINYSFPYTFHWMILNAVVWRGKTISFYLSHKSIFLCTLIVSHQWLHSYSHLPGSKSYWTHLFLEMTPHSAVGDNSLCWYASQLTICPSM